MKKTGFTLAELLITLVVIGIISAITLPAINKLMPDENKINCIKAYDTLSALVKNLASNTKIYPVCKNPEQNDNQNCSEYPLFNTNQPQLLAAFNDDKYSGDKKLCNLLASFMNVKDASCGENVYSFNATNFNTQFNNNKSFITANGMQWYVVPAVASAYADGIGTFQTDVYVDVNGNEAPNCIYNADSCKKPDRFKFMVAADGSVQAADPVSRGYINSRKNFNKQGLNIQESANITSEVRVRTFGLKKCKEQVVATNDDGNFNEEGDRVRCGATYKGYKVNCFTVQDVGSASYTWYTTNFNTEIAKTIGNNSSYTLFVYYTEPVTVEGFWARSDFNNLRYSYNVLDYEKGHKQHSVGEDTRKDIRLGKVSCYLKVGEQMCTATIKMPSIYQDIISASQIPGAKAFFADFSPSSVSSWGGRMIDEQNKMVYIPAYGILDTSCIHVSIGVNSSYCYGATYKIVDLEQNPVSVLKSDLDEIIK